MLGEELVINYEKERLINLDLNEYAEKIRWISKESDSYEYDIESFDVDENGKVYPKFYRAAGSISDNFILDPVTYMTDINIVTSWNILSSLF